MIKAVAIDDEPLALKVLENFCNKSILVTLDRTFTKPTEGLKYLNKFPADLLFLDVRMPTLSGINLAKAISQNTMVVFVTAYAELALDSYERNAIDYLLKPVKYERFEKALEKAKDYSQYLQNKNTSTERVIYIRSEFSMNKIATQDILYIEGLADYVKIHLKDRKPILARMTMKAISEKLSEADFMRVHRSFIVPFCRIQTVRNQIILLPETEIPIGKTYLEEFYKRFPK
jgi:DNA-binding LytR/AlgR family response regulator